MANTRDVASAITSSGRLEARGGVDRAADDTHGPYRRGLRDHAGDSERGGVRPGPGVRRVRDQPGHRQGLVDARLQLAQRRAGRRQRGRRGRVRGHQPRRGGPRRRDRSAVVEPDADRQRPRGHRHGAGLQPRHRVRVHRAGQPDRGWVPRRRQGDLVGAERADRHAGVVLGPGAEPVGQPGRQLRRRAVVHAVVRRPGQHLPRHRQPRPGVRHHELPAGEQPARPGPVHRLGGEAEPGREAAVVLPAHPARPVRLGPAGPAGAQHRERAAGGDRRRQGRHPHRTGRADRQAAVAAPGGRARRARERRAAHRARHAHLARPSCPRSTASSRAFTAAS